jgi:Tfp pilus assembly protein PilX
MSVINLRQMKRLQHNQSGMASIMITMITMIVVSLIVLGFATISRREQGNTLDQQLSTQAFYAAESGVEDARSIIENDVKANQPILPRTSCTANAGGATYATGNQMILSGTAAAPNVQYTCLLVNPALTSAVYTGIGDQPTVVPIDATQTITQLDIAWSPTNNASPSATACPISTTKTFSTAAAWTCNYGLLRMGLVPTSGALNRAGLTSNTLTSFLEPFKSGGTASVSYSGNVGKANVTGVVCGSGAGAQCKVKITGMAGADNVSLELSSLYQESNITISAYHGGTLLTTTGQVGVDVTGDAAGVLRRIQVRIPTNSTSNLIPAYAFQSNAAVCKRYELDKTYFHIPNDITNPDPATMCQTVTVGSP